MGLLQLLFGDSQQICPRCGSRLSKHYPPGTKLLCSHCVGAFRIDRDGIARIVLASSLADRRPPTDKPSWKCPNCHEAIGDQFAICWQCQTTRPAEGAPAEPASPVSTNPTLQADLPCIRCQYNLRGLMPAHRCPECGVPILRSLLDVLRDGMPPNPSELERLLSQPFEAAALTTGYPASALIAVCRAWLRATQPLDSNHTTPAFAAALTCAGLRDEAISCFGSVEEAKAGLCGWAVYGSDEIGQIVRGLMEAGLIQRTAMDPAETFKGILTLDGLFTLSA